METNQATRVLSEALQWSAYARQNERMLAIDRVLVEYPRLRRYFYSNAELRTDDSPEFQQVLAMAELILDTFDSFLSERGSIPVESNTKQWSEFMLDCFRSSTVLRTYLERTRNWHSEELFSVMQTAVATMKLPEERRKGRKRR